ncbi:MAG: hypothetical protein LBT98_03315 [Puniceicoccales bacterium]|jgi:hypothetical protein|nr:hypothetical protein [Puniceicoccales bacterium]
MFFRDLLRAIQGNPCRGAPLLARLLRVEVALVEAALRHLEDRRCVERKTSRHCAGCPFPCGGLRAGPGWVLTEFGRQFLQKSV